MDPEVGVFVIKNLTYSTNLTRFARTMPKEGNHSARACARAGRYPPEPEEPVGVDDADTQRLRKLKVVDVLGASDEAIDKDARWFYIDVHGKTVRDDGRPERRVMRIEAIAGDHFIFQENYVKYYNKWEVVVLHRDAFDVASWYPGWGPRAQGNNEQKFKDRFVDFDDLGEQYCPECGHMLWN